MRTRECALLGQQTVWVLGREDLGRPAHMCGSGEWTEHCKRLPGWPHLLPSLAWDCSSHQEVRSVPSPAQPGLGLLELVECERSEHVSIVSRECHTLSLTLL